MPPRKSNQRNGERDKDREGIKTGSMDKEEEITSIDQEEKDGNQDRTAASKELQEMDEDKELLAKRSPINDSTKEDSEPPTKKKKDEIEPNANIGDEEASEKKRSPELAKLWKAVNDDPADFTAWTCLLQHVDGHGDVTEGREAFDAFLFRYPYCYGYWKKYADFEKKKGSKEKCMLVFERGIKAIPLSVDLWLHYLNHVRSEYADKPDFIRAQYERAVNECGKEWRSDKLWDHYVKWELSLHDLRRTLKLYDRIMLNPTQGLSHQFDMFRDFVKEHNPKDILEASEFLSLRKEILQSQKKESEKDNKDDVKAADDGGPPGKPDSAVQSDDENMALREQIVLSRKKVFKETEEKVHSRYKYEENIKRPYFHMKPLERGQLKNWSDYLDFEIKQGDKERIEILFERCLIACALYVDFWLKYIDWLKGNLRDSDQDSVRMVVDKIRDVFQRVCTHHLPTKVEMHMEWSAFEESQGDLDKAADILKSVEEAHPLLLSLMLKQINLERRRGNYQKVDSLFKSCIERSNADSTRSDLSIKYSRFLRLIRADEKKAIQVLDDALMVDEKNAKLYLQLLDIYIHQQQIDLAKIISVFDATLTDDKDKKLSDRDRFMFSRRKVEFLEDFGTSISELTRAQEEHKKLSYSCDFDELGYHNRSDKAIDGKSSKASTNRQSNGAATTYETTNSTAYGAQHASQYQQYGSRYGSYQAYGQYPNYYQGYSGSYGNYGSGY